MRKLSSAFIVLLISVLSSNTITAQIRKGEFINASVGIGFCSPDDETEIIGNGFYAQGEYVLNLNNWFGVRPYAGIVIASGSSNEEALKDYYIKANAFLLGAKVRLSAPIPYVAPFFEIGIGMSAGSFETFTPLTDVKKKGILYHTPVAFGFAVGRKHNIDIKFTYYFHPSAEQFSGAGAVGFYFPINK